MLIKKICQPFTEIKFRWWDALVILAYIGISTFMITKHEPWSDEAIPWVIARDASVGDFFKIVFLNYDRHPFFYYFILLPFAKLGFPYETLAMLNLVVASAAVIVFMVWAPFPRIVKYLFIFSYFMFYEYVILARPYSLVTLLIFLLALVYPKRFHRPLLYGILIFILLNTDYLCFGLAAALSVFYWLELRKQRPMSRLQKTAIMVMGLGCALAVFQGHTLPKDYAEPVSRLPFLYGNAMNALKKALMPFGPYSRPETVIQISLSVFVWLASVFSLIRKKMPLAVLLAGIAVPLYIFAFVLVGDLRHDGLILIFLLFSLWIAEHSPETNWFKGRINASLPWFGRTFRNVTLAGISLCFVLNIQYVRLAYILEYRFTFSGAKEISAVINNIFDRYQLDQKAIPIVAMNLSASSTLPYLRGRKLWYPCLDDYLMLPVAINKLLACNEMTLGEMVRRTLNTFPDLSKVLFLLPRPLPDSDFSGYRFRLIYAANRQIFGYTYEKFYLYKPEKIVNP